MTCIDNYTVREPFPHSAGQLRREYCPQHFKTLRKNFFNQSTGHCCFARTWRPFQSAKPRAAPTFVTCLATECMKKDKLRKLFFFAFGRYRRFGRLAPCPICPLLLRGTPGCPDLRPPALVSTIELVPRSRNVLLGWFLARSGERPQRRPVVRFQHSLGNLGNAMSQWEKQIKWPFRN